MPDRKIPEYEEWLRYVGRFADAFAEGLTVRAVAGPPVPSGGPVVPRPGARPVLICAPHPDDEVLTGALPLRLLREDGVPVVNLAVTLGSAPARKAARKAEMEQACGVLGFAARLACEPLAFDRVTALSRGLDPAGWREKIDTLAALFEAHDPRLVLFPHVEDSHPCHIGVHYLCQAALLQYSKNRKKEVLAVETEFWRPHRQPNLLLGISRQDAALLVTAVARHKGEIARAPHHLQLPARLMDAVRRGAELIGGFSGLGRALDFLFGELYALARVRDGVLRPCPQKKILPPEERVTVKRLFSLFERN